MVEGSLLASWQPSWYAFLACLGNGSTHSLLDPPMSMNSQDSSHRDAYRTWEISQLGLLR